MPVAETIKPIKVDDEFRTCTVCGYDMGFHVSFQKGAGDTARIVLICPECGARFDVNWDITLSDS
jgi:hypothetical protein